MIGQRHVEKHESGPKPVEMVAKSIKFNRPEIDLAANQPAVIDFRNVDSVPHNIAIYEREDYSGLPLFQGAVIVGPNKTVYRLTAPAAGTYYFRCDIHPTTMTGKVLVA
jgi:plastocyanin